MESSRTQPHRSRDGRQPQRYSVAPRAAGRRRVPARPLPSPCWRSHSHPGVGFDTTRHPIALGSRPPLGGIVAAIQSGGKSFCRSDFRGHSAGAFRNLQQLRVASHSNFSRGSRAARTCLKASLSWSSAICCTSVLVHDPDSQSKRPWWSPRGILPVTMSFHGVPERVIAIIARQVGPAPDQADQPLGPRGCRSAIGPRCAAVHDGPEPDRLHRRGLIYDCPRSVWHR